MTMGQSNKAREIQPTSLFHTANKGDQEGHEEFYRTDENVMQEGDSSFSHSHHYHEEDLPEQDVSPVKTVIVTNKKRKRHNSNSTGTPTLVMNSTDPKDSKIPSKTFKDIIGHRSVKLRLEEIILPLRLPTELATSVFRGIRSLPASVLFHGPPGEQCSLSVIVVL